MWLDPGLGIPAGDLVLCFNGTGKDWVVAREPLHADIDTRCVAAIYNLTSMMCIMATLYVKASKFLSLI